MKKLFKLLKEASVPDTVIETLDDKLKLFSKGIDIPLDLGKSEAKKASLIFAQGYAQGLVEADMLEESVFDEITSFLLHEYVGDEEVDEDEEEDIGFGEDDSYYDEDEN